MSLIQSIAAAKSPDIVFADADLDAAVPGAAMSVFANSGQICSAGTRLFVEQDIYDEFVGRVADYGKKLKVGNGADPQTQIGPLVSTEQLERATGYLDAGSKDGANALTGALGSPERLVDASVAPRAGELANQLKRHWTDRRLSLQKLADLAGVSRSMLSKIERLEAILSAEMFKKLAKAIDVPLPNPSRPEDRSIIHSNFILFMHYCRL